MKQIKKIKLSLLFFVAHLTHAGEMNFAVNMQDGGLILNEASDSIQNVNRTYRSRSLDHGFFGMGWCTDFESKLIFQGRGVVRLINCQSSRYGLYRINASASAYVREDDDSDRIHIKLGAYERKVNGAALAQYNMKGQLTEYSKDSKVFKLTYNTRQLPQMITSAHFILKLQWHPVLDLVTQLESAKKKIVFSYSGLNLSKTTEGLKNVYYEYDDLDNLTSRRSSNEKSLHVQYDKDADRVTRIQNKCLEVYAYDKISPQRKLATVSKLCGKHSSKKEFKFEYAQNSTRATKIDVTEKTLSGFERLSAIDGGAQ